MRVAHLDCVPITMLLLAHEYADLRGVPVTTPERTAFDIGRRGRLDDAVARLDALGNATGIEGG